MVNYTYNSTHLLMNKGAFDRLTADQKKVLLEEAVKAGVAMQKAVRSQEASQIEELKKNGMQVAYPDTKAFAAAAAPVYDELKKMVGDADYATYMQMLEKSRK